MFFHLLVFSEKQKNTPSPAVKNIPFQMDHGANLREAHKRKRRTKLPFLGPCVLLGPKGCLTTHNLMWTLANTPRVWHIAPALQMGQPRLRENKTRD